MIAFPLVLLGLVVAHILALHDVGSNNPDGIEIKKTKGPDGHPLDGIPFHPYYTVKDIVGAVVFLAIFCFVMFFVPEMGGYFLEYNNFIPADPLKTPEHIAPVWYFTPYYSILRAVPPLFNSQFPGVLAMGIATMILFFLPWLDRSPVKSIRYRGVLYKSWLAAFVVVFLMLGYLGTELDHGLGPVRLRRLLASTPRTSPPGRRACARCVYFAVLLPHALVHRARQGAAGARAGDVHEKAPARRCCSRRSPPRGSEAGYPLDRSPHDPRDLVSLQVGRAHLRQLLPRLPQRAVHALPRPDRDRPHRGADPRQPDVHRRQDRRADEGPACSVKDGKQWFGVAPPDLSVIARSRGADWLYTYLRTFYRDPKTANGWNNAVFPNVGMPHALWMLQGERRLEVADRRPRPRRVQVVARSPRARSRRPSTTPPVRDLVNFLVYVGEPHAGEPQGDRRRHAVRPRRAVRARLSAEEGILERRALTTAAAGRPRGSFLIGSPAS